MRRPGWLTTRGIAGVAFGLTVGIGISVAGVALADGGDQVAGTCPYTLTPPTVAGQPAHLSVACDLPGWPVAPTTPLVVPTTTAPATTPPVTTTAAPTPTVTTTPPPANQRPNASNRGLPAGSHLVDNSSCRIAGSNIIVTGQRFTCRVSIAGSNVTIRDSQLLCGIDNWTSAGGHSFTLVDVTVGPIGNWVTGQCSADYGDQAKRLGCIGDFGLGATDFTAERVSVTGFSDGGRLSGRSTPAQVAKGLSADPPDLSRWGISIDDSYLRTCHIDGAHSDGLQGDGNVSAVSMTGNTIDLRPSHNDWTAALFYPTDGALTADGNILAGGGYLFQIGGGGPFTLTNNDLVDASWQYGPANVPCAKTTWANNVTVTLDAAGQPGPGIRTVACS